MTPSASGSYWNGDEWRWRLTAPTSVRTLAVIEPGADADSDRDEKAEKNGARKVPFGFSRAVPEPGPAEPLLWEGDNA